MSNYYISLFDKETKKKSNRIPLKEVIYDQNEIEFIFPDDMINELYVSKDKIKKLKNQVETKISKAELDRNYGRYKQYGGKIKCDKYLAQLYGYKQAFSLLLNEGEEENE